MKIIAYKTHVILPKESILEIIDQYIASISEKSVLIITSKIISLCQNRIIPKHQVPNKLKLIQEEAEFYLEGDYSEKYGICLTIKNGILIPTAGIDESNGNENYVLYPQNIQKEAFKIWNYLREKHQLKKLGILITDSHTTPLRRGVTGIALGWCGFEPLCNYIGKEDIFGRPLHFTQLNILDTLASAAILVMGEGNEQTPLALLTETEKIVFQDHPPSTEEHQSISISIEEDLYAPLLTHQNWKTTH